MVREALSPRQFTGSDRAALVTLQDERLTDRLGRNCRELLVERAAATLVDVSPPAVRGAALLGSAHPLLHPRCALRDRTPAVRIVVEAVADGQRLQVRRLQANRAGQARGDDRANPVLAAAELTGAESVRLHA